MWSRIIVVSYGVNARGSDASVDHRVEFVRIARVPGADLD